MFRNTLVFIVLFSLPAACGAPRRGATSRTTEAWDRFNDPLDLGSDYERHFTSLPSSAQLPSLPWSDDYWPTNRGGVAVRWYTGNGAQWQDGFSYTPPTLAALRAMSMEQKAHLSPAEKLDIIAGRLDYPLVQRMRQISSPSAPSWWGICHGWSESALLYGEPSPGNYIGANDIAIPFGSSDIKGLSAYFQTQDFTPRRSMGRQCHNDLRAHPDLANTAECRDVNAGSFHLILANFIALRHQGFIADVTRDLEVWNQPVYAYSTHIVRWQGPSRGAASGTVSEVVVATDMSYSRETVPHWEKTGGTAAFGTATVRYNYRLELNARGEIIGGEWLDYARPDYLWLPMRAAASGESPVLEFIRNNSTGGDHGYRDAQGVYYPYCRRSGDTGGGFGWEPELGGPHGGSCKVRG